VPDDSGCEHDFQVKTVLIEDRRGMSMEFVCTRCAAVAFEPSRSFSGTMRTPEGPTPGP
jgi:hypothetical protein